MDKIDIVIPWVDSSDSQWKSERNKYLPEFKEEKSHLSHYFREWDTLKYVFRGVEKNMSWIRNIHFITCGHLPKWLNTDNSKIKVHFHKDFFDKESVLPVFSSHPIEMNLRNIPGLSEKFIYFNDDTLVVKPVTPNRFFEGELPVDYLVLDLPRGGWLYDIIRVKDPYAQVCKNTVKILNERFPITLLRKTKSHLFFDSSYLKLDILRNKLLTTLGVHKWIKVNHHPQGFLLSNLNKCEELFPNEIHTSSKNRFRSYEDVNQYLFRFYALLTGNFVPHFFNDSFCIVLSSIKRYQKERSSLFEKSFVCLNDSPFLKEKEYPELNKMVTNDLIQLFPSKSSFEK